MCISKEYVEKFSFLKCIFLHKIRFSQNNMGKLCDPMDFCALK